MRTMALLLASLLMAGCSGCASVPSHDELRALALRLVFESPDGFYVCGGTPIAADSFSTAAHCVDGKRLLTVGEATVQVRTVSRGQGDRVLVQLTKPIFKRWAKQGALPKQGDRVRFWGNPRGFGDVFRVGAVVNVSGGVVAVDAMTCHGDSGSGLFNDAGELVAVVSRLVPEVGPCQFMVAQP